MSDDRHTEKLALGLVAAAGALSGAYGLLAILLRVTAPWTAWLNAVQPAFSMAAHNSVLILLFGAALFVLAKGKAAHRPARIFILAVSALGTLVGLIVLLRIWIEPTLEIERWLAALTLHPFPDKVRRMSPHTGLIVLCLGAALALVGPTPQKAWRCRYAALAFAAFALTASAFALGAYALGVPLSPESFFSRIRWTTSGAFALQALALMLAAFPRNWVLESFARRSEPEPHLAALRRFQRALAFALLGFAVAFGIAGIHFLRREKANLRARAEQELLAVANLKVAQISEWRASRLKEAYLAFQTPYGARRALDFLSNPDSDSTRGIYLGWLRPFLAIGPFAQALLLDDKFNVHLVYPETADRRLTEAERLALETARLKREVIATDLHLMTNGEPQVLWSMAVPILVRREGDRDNVAAAGRPISEKDRAVAFQLLRVDAAGSLFRLVSPWPTPSPTAEVLLARRESNEVVILNAPRHMPVGPMQLRLPVAQARFPCVLAALGEERTVSSTDYRGEPVLAITRRVPKTAWALVVKMDDKEIYEPMRERGLTLAAIMAVLLLATGLGVNLLWRRRDVELLQEQLRTEHERLTLAQRFGHLMRHANDIVLLTDEQWRILDANERALQTYGYTLDEFKAMRVPELRAPSERAAFQEIEARLAESGEIRGETLHQRKDGRTFPVEFSVSRVNIDGGNQHLAIIRDVSERRRAELSLRASEERFRMLAESSLAGIYLIQDQRFRYVNPAFAAIFGYRPEEIIGRLGPMDLTHPEDWPRVVEQIRRRMQGEVNSVRYEFRAVRKDGSVIHIEVLGSRIEYQGRPAILGTLMDTTERRRAEEQMRRQAALLDAANEAIYVRALDDTVTYWNAGAERLFGWKRDEILGRKFTEVSETDAGAMEAAKRALLKTGHWSGELTKTTKTGRRVTVFCRWTLLRDERGQPAEVLVINSDITEKKQLETQFLRAQRMESIGALAGGIAHDLNNILAPILMSASLLRETVTDPQSRNILSTITACAHRAADIVRQLLTFARGQPGTRVPVPVKHLFKEMAKIIHETFPRNIRTEFHAPDDLWMVMGDATQIHQALMNLCLNARDAMPEGGTLSLRALNLTLDERAASLSPDARPGRYVCLSVTDTGCGIPPEHLERLFEPFFTTKAPGKGTGLGLATVLGIVRGHGGFVRVHSRPGEGTTFELYLPASDAPVATADEDTDFSPPRGRGEGVLVVDDETSVRASVQQALENHGYRVLTAADGREALALFEQSNGRIRIVLTDMMMPNMDGPALVRALRARTPNLLILGMTGLAQRPEKHLQEELGLAALLLKPFSVADLLKTLDEARKGRRATATAA